MEQSKIIDTLEMYQPPTVRDSGADDNKGPGLSGLQPTTISETGEQIPSKDDCAPRAASGDSGHIAGHVAASICLEGAAYLNGYSD